MTRNTSKSGFTLLEVVIAGSLLTIMVGGFTAALISAMRTHYLAGYQYSAVSIARNRMQRAWTLSYETLPMLEESKTSVDACGTLNPSGKFLRSTLVDTNTMANCVKLTVQVYFPTFFGTTCTNPVTLVTAITPHEM